MFDLCRFPYWRSTSASHSLLRLSIGMVILAGLVVPPQNAHAQDDWPTPYVALYDCNTSAAFTNTVAEKNTLDSASLFVLNDILADTTSRNVFLFSVGFADTGSADMSFLGRTFPLPDTGTPSDQNYHFIISSTITGDAAGYELKVSLIDRATYTHVADGTAQFTSVTAGNVGTACVEAAGKILPLPEKIREYWKSLKAANSSLVISPQFDVSPASLKLSPGGSTDITITLTDCDGLPVAGRELSLESTAGATASPSVVTDDHGKATVAFTAGDSKGYEAVTAWLRDAATVGYDTLTYSGQTTLVIGEEAAADLWVLDFDMRRWWTGYNDKLVRRSDGTEWAQKNTSWTQRARGKIYGTPNGDSYREFDFIDTTMSVSGLYQWHQFAKSTYTDLTPGACPRTTFQMSGTTQNYVAALDEDTHGRASFEYTTDHSTDMFDVEVPFTQASYYAYNWHTSGTRVNDECVTESSHQAMRMKWISTTGGMGASTLFATPGFSILPLYSGNTLLGYSIYISRASSGYLSDLTCYYQQDQCVATLKPFSTVTAVTAAPLPLRFGLEQNYPNPFNPRTSIGYQLASAGKVSLRVYDVLGREVATLVNEAQGAGRHAVEFDGSRLPSGVYFYRMTAGQFTEVKKLMMIK